MIVVQTYPLGKQSMVLKFCPQPGINQFKPPQGATFIVLAAKIATKM
jgi:hypothetical protein